MSAPAPWQPGDFAFPVEEVDAFLLWAADRGASDAAFRTGAPAAVEIDGVLTRATRAVLDGATVERLAERLAGPAALGVLRSGRGVDCSHAVRRDRGRTTRFRVSMAAVLVRHGFGIDIVLRVLPDRVPELHELGVEDGIAAAWRRPRGLTLVTGVPGSGKSTLLAAGTRQMLESGVGRIQSYEAPIEFVFDGIGSDGAMMASSEIPLHFESFAAALRSSLRRRPAAVIVGEARDRETVGAVVRAADYGIATFATAHTVGVAATIRRLLAEFAAHERAERGAALVDVLHVVVTQALLPRPGGGRTAVREWLAFTPELKADLLAMPQEAWAARIAADVAAAGAGLADGARRAFRRGAIARDDLLRLAAAAGAPAGRAA